MLVLKTLKLILRVVFYISLGLSWILTLYSFGNNQQSGLVTVHPHNTTLGEVYQFFKSQHLVPQRKRSHNIFGSLAGDAASALAADPTPAFSLAADATSALAHAAPTASLGSLPLLKDQPDNVTVGMFGYCLSHGQSKECRASEPDVSDESFGIQDMFIPFFFKVTREAAIISLVCSTTSIFLLLLKYLSSIVRSVAKRAFGRSFPIVHEIRLLGVTLPLLIVQKAVKVVTMIILFIYMVANVLVSTLLFLNEILTDTASKILVFQYIDGNAFRLYVAILTSSVLSFLLSPVI